MFLTEIGSTESILEVLVIPLALIGNFFLIYWGIKLCVIFIGMLSGWASMKDLVSWVSTSCFLMGLYMIIGIVPVYLPSTIMLYLMGGVVPEFSPFVKWFQAEYFPNTSEFLVLMFSVSILFLASVAFNFLMCKLTAQDRGYS